MDIDQVSSFEYEHGWAWVLAKSIACDYLSPASTCADIRRLATWRRLSPKFIVQYGPKSRRTR
jgi:hypothetical protein